MKIIADYGINKEGKKALVGYTFEAENADEENVLSSIRDYIFWGDDEEGTRPKYEGRYDNEESGLVKGLMFEIPANMARCISGELDTKNLSERRKFHINTLFDNEKKNYQKFLNKE